VDRQARRVLKLAGDPDDPRSRGYICPKAFASQGIYEDPERLRSPQRRIRAGWQEVSWDDAYDEVAERLLSLRNSHGPMAIAYYIGNPIGHDVGSQFYLPHLLQGLGSPRGFSAITMDQFPQVVAARLMFGRGMLPVPDLDHCDYFLILGGNPLVSQGSIMSAPDMKRRLHELRQRGGRVVVVDPRRSETAAAADQHHFIRPGSDAFLLFAMIQTLFAEGLVNPGRLADASDGLRALEQVVARYTPSTVAGMTGIPGNEITALARDFAAAPRACVYGRIGTCTQTFGTLASFAIYALNYLTGNLDETGGSMFPRFATGDLEDAPTESGPMPVGRFKTVVRGLPEVNGTLPSAVMAEEIDAAGEDRIRALLTICGNPVLSVANGARLGTALEQLDFMVSLDIYRNETTRHADLILPSRVQLECENFDYMFQGTTVRNYVRWSDAVLPGEPGLPEQWQVMLEIGARLAGVSAEELEQSEHEKALARYVGPAARRCQEVSIDTAREALSDDPGPMRRLDLLLRSGPLGDGFRDDAIGLSLARLREADGVVDLGPLKSRLPGLLRSPGRRIQLMPRELEPEFARLAASFDVGPRTGLLLVGRRQLRNMNSWLHNLPSLAAGRPRCELLMHPDDAAERGLETGATARLCNRSGEIDIPVRTSDEMMRGVVSLPHGYGHTDGATALSVARDHQPGQNANGLTDALDLDTISGTSVANGIPVTVTATKAIDAKTTAHAS
jgi:anaerobic selenocysteine-containing dehydrogenase